jgi:Zn-dependent protease with chaperone function
VTSGLIEMLDEAEIQAVVAHGCGHIACRHVLYHTMAEMLINLGSGVFGVLAKVSMPVQLALLYWMRRSELSCDRAAAIVMKDTQPVVETMIRLAGGPKSLTGKVNLDLYVHQADAYDKLLESSWDKFLQGVVVMNMSHPFLAVRSREIVRWGESESFRRVLAALDGGSGPACPQCRGTIETGWRFCNHCGQPLPSADAPATEEKEYA